MKQLPPGKLLDIVTGRTSQPASVVERYRQELIKTGFEIPGIGERVLTGAGTRLKRTLKRLGFKGFAGCNCSRIAADMDKHGPQWCRDNMNELLNRMQQSHQQLKKANSIILPWSRTVVKRLILRAIKQSEKEIEQCNE